MYTELSVKLKALTLAVMINSLIMGGAAFLFDGQLHSSKAPHFTNNSAPAVSRVHASMFRP